MATLVVLMAISVIPPIEAGGISLRRANILSDLIRFDSDKAPAAEPAQPEIDVEEFHVDMEEVERQVARVAQEASPTGDGTSASWQGIFEQQPVEADTTLTDTFAADSLEAHRRAVAEADFSALLPADTLITPVEEFFEGEGPSPLQRLYDKLLDGSQPVRIAFMGDSFVEGDILTADLREMLQGVQRHIEYMREAIERQRPVIAEPLDDIAPAGTDTLDAELPTLPAPLTDDDLRPEPEPLPLP